MLSVEVNWVGCRMKRCRTEKDDWGIDGSAWGTKKVVRYRMWYDPTIACTETYILPQPFSVLHPIFSSYILPNCTA